MAYRDEHTALLDVERTHLGEADRERTLEKIQDVLSPFPSLHYYQGYHEIALNCESSDQLRDLSLFNLRDFMTPSLEPTIYVLDLIPQLLWRADKQLGKLVRGIHPHYALASIITLFAHDIEYADGDMVSSLVQSIISRVQTDGIASVIYVYAALLITHKASILSDIGPDNDPDIVHTILTKAGKKIQTTDLEKLFLTARQLQNDHPLPRLRGWRKLSRHSALRSFKTSVQSAAADSRALARPQPGVLRMHTRMAVAVLILVVGLALHRRRP